jgi:hypothetical protein
MNFETKMKMCMAVMLFGALFLLLYALGKIAGIIHSPIWVDMSPYITAASTVGAILISTGMVLQKIANMDRHIQTLEVNLRDLKTEVKSEFQDVRKEGRELHRIIHAVQDRFLVIETKLTVR